MNASVSLALGPCRRATAHIAIAAALSLATLACGSGASTNSTTASTTSTATPNAYTAVYKSLTWGSTITVAFPSTCEMTLTTTGIPDYTPNPYYLAPASSGQTVVAYTSSTNTALAVIAYATTIKPTLKGSSATINICPTQASSTTATSLGAIGYLISGTAMFNPFEMNASTAAIADNASYTFTDSTGTQQTAWFVDQCDSHSNGSTWHAHGNPSCVTSQVDTASGPSHIIGIALDGFPIYGGRDINGNTIAVSQLDACNGITSPTPEFPAGAYHYVLPLGVTTRQASINCYAGTASTATIAAARKLACNMKMMFASAPNLPTTPALPSGPSRTSRQDSVAANSHSATMLMRDGTTMPTGSM